MRAQRRPLPAGAAALAHHLSAGQVYVRLGRIQQPRAQINPIVVTPSPSAASPSPQAYPKPLIDKVASAADVIITMG